MTADEQPGIFGQPVQPWDPLPDDPSDAVRQERDRVLAMLARSEIATVEARVALLLQKYPETRDNDIELAIRYWHEFEAVTVASVDPLTLDVLHGLQPMATIIRCRQRLQNDFGLFVGTRRTRAMRDEQQLMFYQYLAEKREDDPELCFYLDETGADSQSRFVGVAGICVLDTRSYAMRHAALRQWRSSQGWVETLHFADMDAKKATQFLQVLAQLHKYRAGLMFVGYAALARGNKDAVIAALFVQLIGDALRKAEQQGCLGKGRAVRVIKEAAEGFDALHLTALEQDLSQHLLQLFPNRVYLKGVTPLPKGREVLLECADVVAASMRRRWESGHSIHKDRIAEAVMNVTGFEDSRDGTALYQVHRS